jgi:hypothetical protein
MFETKGYQVIDLNFGFEASLIVQTFEEVIKIHNIQPKHIDIVSIPPITLHMEMLAMIIQREYLTSIIEKKINLKLTPTYCIVRKYFKGSILSTHRDRDECEISLTYTVSGPEWGIHMGDDTVTTKIGNGVIYKGCEMSHGRLKPSSGEVIQVFNHWVISDGTRSNYAYDGGKNKEYYE